jgi:hypothetical protein
VCVPAEVYKGLNKSVSYKRYADASIRVEKSRVYMTEKVPIKWNIYIHIPSLVSIPDEVYRGLNESVSSMWYEDDYIRAWKSMAYIFQKNCL